MKQEQYGEPDDFIVPLNINGLEGRMLRLPSKNKKNNEILFVYGQHSSIERCLGAAELLSKSGNVTMPDLPGMGGMTPLYKIGKQPTIDNMADYLAAFIKLKYKNKRITIIGMSLGFVIATRMLQKYPELGKKVNLLISLVGFGHKSDFIFSKKRMFVYLNMSRIFTRKWPAKVFRYTALQPFVLRSGYHRTNNAKDKFDKITAEEFKRTMDAEIKLWHINDIRTQFKHYVEMLTLDNTKQSVDIPVHHVATKNDRYFDNLKVEEHLSRIFRDFTLYYAKTDSHAPTITPSVEQASAYLPHELRRLIGRKVKV